MCTNDVEPITSNEPARCHASVNNPHDREFKKTMYRVGLIFFPKIREFSTLKLVESKNEKEGKWI